MNVYNIYAEKEAVISKQYPTTNFSNYKSMLCGQYYTAINIYRSLIRFNIDVLPVLGNFYSSSLSLYIYDNGNTQVPKDIKIYQLSSAFDEKTVTYNTQPTYYEYEVSNKVVTTQNFTFIEFDVTSLVRTWYHAEFENYGIDANW